MRLSNIVTMKYIWLIIFLILPIVGVLLYRLANVAFTAFFPLP